MAEADFDAIARRDLEAMASPWAAAVAHLPGHGDPVTGDVRAHPVRGAAT